jgi:16S rRNA (guanine527-N7)-methyltransferase
VNWEELPGLFPAFGGPGRWLPLLKRHQEMLVAAAERVRVTAVAEEDVVRRQFAESLELWRITLAERPGTSSLVDVGSGGGFPGMAIAAVAPDLAIALVEPLQKRARLLAEIAADLGLLNVSVFAQRAEEAGRGPLRDSADAVVARAVAPLAELLEYTAPFARPGGVLALAKGSRAEDEITAAGHACSELAVTGGQLVPFRREVSDTVAAVVLSKVGPTPPAYPRRAGVPGKRPL